jgi:hypothetical protein
VENWFNAYSDYESAVPIAISMLYNIYSKDVATETNINKMAELLDNVISKAKEKEINLEDNESYQLVDLFGKMNHDGGYSKSF